MCRITGIRDFNFKAQYPLDNVLAKMRETLIPGGPDAKGEFIDTGNGIALGHRRLSILDLSELGNQPMHFKHLSMVYNGEVYNFKEIKNDLEKEGYAFTSDSDSEVILKGFYHWGKEVVKRFRGMFAFAIWNHETKNLLLCRDRVGVKPLYYYHHQNLFLFASELKSFHEHPQFKKELSLKAVSLYFQHGYITAPYSIFENTFKVKPGSFVEINNGGEVTETIYWNVQDFYEKPKIDADYISVKNTLHQELIEAFKLRMVADVPVGMFLSGGIDSSLVTSILQNHTEGKVKTFTIGFDENGFDESKHAKATANYLGTDHTEYICKPKDAQELLHQLPEIYDEPFADSSAIPTIMVAKVAKQKVKVSLSADGGDELFFGYTRYKKFPSFFHKLQNNTLQKTAALMASGWAQPLFKNVAPYSKLFRKISDGSVKAGEMLRVGNDVLAYNSYLKYYNNTTLNELGLHSLFDHSFLVNEKMKSMDLANQMMLFDTLTYLPGDIMTKVDRATMFVALEGREPMLDHHIIELAAQIPINYKFKEGIDKYILKDILSEYLPKDLYDRPKKGFGIPLFQWLKNDLINDIKSELNKESISKTNLFNSDKVDSLVKKLLKEDQNNLEQLWFILVFMKWYNRWMN